MSAKRPIILGEVLFDHFPDDGRQLGGAPFNVAWNLKGMGLDPLLVTAVGDDEAGEEVLARMREWGLDTGAVQQGCSLPTGKVEVTVDNGQPTFDILDNRAWDAIREPELPASLDQFALVYLGSLALRHEVSRESLLGLAAQSGLPWFVDINIRQPWFEGARLEDLLPNAHWVKLNDAELGKIAEQPCETPEQVHAAVEVVRQRYGGACFLVTCGAAGAYAIDADGRSNFAPAVAPSRMQDTVGAGDAFAAAMIGGILRDQALQESLEQAVRFASKACTLQGATTTNQDHYKA